MTPTDTRPTVLSWLRSADPAAFTARAASVVRVWFAGGAR